MYSLLLFLFIIHSVFCAVPANVIFDPPTDTAVKTGTNINMTSNGATVICYRRGASASCDGTDSSKCDTNSLEYDANDKPKKTDADETTKITAIGCNAEGPSVNVKEVVYSVVLTPVFTPDGGPYANGQTVSITSDTNGAVICYSSDGTTTPACNGGSCSVGTTYAGVISKQTSDETQWKAIGCKDSLTPSAIATSNAFTAKVENPVFSPDGGSLKDGTTVTITSATYGATICFLRGTLSTQSPACNAAKTGCATGDVYSTAKKTNTDNNYVWKAIACLPNYTDSDVVSTTATFLLGATADPTFSPDGGIVNNGATITISTLTSGAMICYSNNSAIPPVCNVAKTACATGEKYTAPVPKAATDDGNKWSAIACLSGQTDSSTIVTTSVFANNVVTEHPVFSSMVYGGVVPDNTVVTITSATANAIICYTLDSATTPVCDSAKTGCTTGTLYSGGITKLNSHNGKSWSAIACLASQTDSAVVTTSVFSTPVCSYPQFNPDGGAVKDDTSIVITTNTTNAIICYTLASATTPVCDSTKTSCTTGTKYTIPVSKASSDNGNKWAAIACLAGYTDSSVSIMNDSFAAGASGGVATPVFNPNGGAINDGTSVTITTTTSGAIICYTRDGTTTPVCDSAKTSCTAGTKYTTAFVKASSDDNKLWAAVGCKSGESDSAIVKVAVYGTANMVVTPYFNPDGGEMKNGNTVTIASNTTGAILCYSRDYPTTTPVCNSTKTGCTTGTLYATPISKESSDNGKRWAAVACLSSKLDSTIAVSNEWKADSSSSSGSATLSPFILLINALLLFSIGLTMF